MTSEFFDEVEKDPSKLKFIYEDKVIDEKDPTKQKSIKYTIRPPANDRQDIDHFKESGYCTLLSISDTYSILIYARNDVLFVCENKDLKNLVSEKKEGLSKIQMPGQVWFLSIIDEFVFV